MKQKNLRVGQTVYIKKSFRGPASYLARGSAFTIKSIIYGEKGINHYYDEMDNMVLANELTEIPCGQKDCPCH